MVLLAIVTLLGAIVIGLEVGLRSLFGFGKPLLYVADPQVGYLLAPNQKTRRFGNQILINQYSMRSGAIAPQPTQGTFRVLLLGDSIANGGWWTDQQQTISALLQKALLSGLQSSDRKASDRKSSDRKSSVTSEVEVLNASANSWGPRNELAYLQRFGSFGAKWIVLLINTDDLFATAPTSIPVGRDRNYPDHRPTSAIVETWNRYLVKPKPIPELEAWHKEGGDRVGINLEAIRQIQAYATQHQTRLLVVMTPLLRELGTPGSRDYEQKARQRLQEFTQQSNITYLDLLPILNQTKDAKSLYQDHIHFNPKGNQFITQNLFNFIQP
jgi:lysophospholipase L1-like esterase